MMLENVTVRDWMTNGILTVSAATSITQAHQIMKDHGVRRLVVLENEQLQGIITIGDVREASPSDATSLSIWELNYLWAQLTVEKVMRRNVITIKASQPILDAAEIMLDRKISGIPVVDDDKHVIGMLTESDIFRMLVKSRNKVSL